MNFSFSFRTRSSDYTFLFILIEILHDVEAIQHFQTPPSAQAFEKMSFQFSSRISTDRNDGVVAKVYNK